jgi:hypothetical protein
MLYVVDWYIVSGMPSFLGLPNSLRWGSMLLHTIGNCLKSTWCYTAVDLNFISAAVRTSDLAAFIPFWRGRVMSQ